MKVFGFQSLGGNFGDDLNLWLWPKVFPDLERMFLGATFVGIGSILCREFLGKMAPGTKIVFGAGARGSDSAKETDGAWNFRFVRGPLTAIAFNLESSRAITDPALLVRNYFSFESTAKLHRVAFMPYFETVGHGPWEAVCVAAGVHMIDPRWPVMKILESLAATERLITESLHGAIVADAFRVPWTRVDSFASRWEQEAAAFKWRDWTMTVGVDPFPLKLPQLRLYRGQRTGIRRQLRQLTQAFWSSITAHHAVFRLRQIADGATFRLSKLSTVSALEHRLAEQVVLLRNTQDLNSFNAPL